MNLKKQMNLCLYLRVLFFIIIIIIIIIILLFISEIYTLFQRKKCIYNNIIKYVDYDRNDLINQGNYIEPSSFNFFIHPYS